VKEVVFRVRKLIAVFEDHRCILSNGGVSDNSALDPDLPKSEIHLLRDSSYVLHVLYCQDKLKEAKIL
jgi:hypothetical protein